MWLLNSYGVAAPAGLPGVPSQNEKENKEAKGSKNV